MKVETFVNLCGVSTRVATWGKGLYDVKSEEVQDIVLMIPGNPGYIPLYEEFLEELHNRLGLPVWIVGHAGHEPPRISKSIPPLKGNEALYDTNGQIIHKQMFIEQYVPSNARLYLIGHSVGTYLIVQLLKLPGIRAKTVGTYHLFPTIERIADSPKGKSFVAFMKFQKLVLLFMKILTLMPVIVQSLFIELTCTLSGTPKRYRTMYVDLIQPSMMEKVFFMADDEMIVIKERDTDTLKANVDKIKLYYGANDGWTPPSYYTQLKQDIPEIDIEICSHNYKHSFTSRHSKDIAQLVAGWIEKKRL